MDAVERQLEAYNARDIDAFMACFNEVVLFEDAGGRLLLHGRGELRQTYGPIFRDRPELKADLVWRERFGEYVVDSEVVTGLATEPQHGVAIYHIDDRGLIDHVRVIR